MKRILSIVAVVIAIPLWTFGLLFLIAAAANPSRILVAAALLVAGVLPLAWGIRTLRRAAELRPEAMAVETVALARRLGGEVTVAQMQAEFRVSAGQALKVLEKLRAEGLAHAEQRKGRTVYVVRGLQPGLVTRRCPYCGTTFPVREALQQCPNCGASLEVGKT